MATIHARVPSWQLAVVMLILTRRTMFDSIDVGALLWQVWRTLSLVWLAPVRT